ncbi:MAG: AI-2E family transporter [Nanoarchaeota archaeon]|nr:AI-2E family transporter [Nanoarchaeota archaeon]MBU1501501.1 AI-2E family transporter [Nanoarchaeota archaeon]
MEENFKKIASIIIIISLLVLSFFIIKPILVSIIMALILAFIFAPVYDWIYKRINNKSLSAALIILILLIIIILPIWFFLPILMRQSVGMLTAVRDLDFVTPIKSIFPGLFDSQEISIEVGYALSTLTTRAIDTVIGSLTKIIINIPTILLHLTVLIFTFFFVIREKEAVVGYVKSLLPFSKEVEKKLFDQTKGITSSILYGQFIIGIIQGIVVGISLFIFNIPNPLFLTILAVILGILPVIGTFLVWMPLAIYLFSTGRFFSAWGIIAFGLISSNIDNVLKPMIVSRRTNINTGILFTSMIGGLAFFGVLGLILGPLIISYLFLILELYRGSGMSGIVSSQGLKGK